MKVNLGCGGDIREGYLNYDSRDLPGIQICDSLWNLPVHVQGAEEILALDVIEHVPWPEQRKLFEMLYRCLAPEGCLKIKTPDIKVLAAFLLFDLISEEEVVENVFGRQDYPENTHYVGYSVPRLARMLESVGFKNSRFGRTGSFNIFCEVFKP